MNDPQPTDEVVPEQVAVMCRLSYLPTAATVPGAVITAFAMGPSVTVVGRMFWVAALVLQCH
jgi:hypothetical protein